MNKALHALVYVILALAIVALVFELNLFNKRALLGDRNLLLEDYVVKVAKTIEQADAPKPATPPEIKKDTSPVEDRAVENPETENLLDDYPAQLEQQNLQTFGWENSRLQLRQLYFLDSMGKTVPDVANYNKPMTKGKGTMTELLEQLFDRAKAQQANLNSTRAELAALRGKLETVVAELNKLKQEDRADKVTITEQKAKIAQLESEKAALEAQVKSLKGQIDDLNAEITSLKDELTRAKEETEGVKEDLAKAQKLVEQLKRLLYQAQHVGGGSNSSVTSISAGDKGKVVEVNNEMMFAIVELSDATMTELLGAEREGALPQIELGIKRPGFQGAAGEFVGRIRLRQAVAGKNFVIADVLGDWQQSKAEKGDVVFSE